MFYDQNQSRIIMSYPALLAAYPDAGDLSTEPARNALGLYLVHEQPPAYDPLTHTLALDGVELVGGVYQARYVLTQLPPDQVRGIAAAVALHVHACYAAERAHHDAIAAASDAELYGYDINAGWPA